MEVCELHLHRHGSAEGSGILAPGPDVIGHGRDAGLDFIKCCQIAREGGLGAGGFSTTTGRSSFPFAMARYQVADLPKCCCRKANGFARRSAPVSIPSRRIFAAVPGSDPVKSGDRQRGYEVRTHLEGDGELAIRLALAGCKLGEELVVGDAR
jgi:hypothetical protein